ncbi:MAG: amidohydrolase family protein [Deltaproteobacteria bacterium]|nr:amidohydrolase family protein [Deltaproteobacteria bacterium]
MTNPVKSGIDLLAPKTDAHAHVGYFGSWCDVGATADEMVALMADYGIKRTIISYPDDAVTLDAAAKYPNQLIPLTWINPGLGASEIARLDRLTVNKAVAGIKFHPLFNSYTADDSCVDPVMAIAVKRDLPVFIHSGHPPFSLPWSIGQLAERFPQARIVMVHMGHGHGVYIQAALAMAKKYPNIWLETSGMPMHTKIKEAYETVGPDRIFWGSDFPFHHYAVEILRSEVSGLQPAGLRALFYENVNKFLGF